MSLVSFVGRIPVSAVLGASAVAVCLLCSFRNSPEEKNSVEVVAPVPKCSGLSISGESVRKWLASVKPGPGEGAPVQLTESRAAELDALLRKILKDLPPFMLHERAVEEFHRDVDAGVVRFRRDGAPWLDWPSDGSRPDFRVVLEDGGKRLRITYFYNGLDNEFGTREEVYVFKEGEWKEISSRDDTYTVPDGRVPASTARKMQGLFRVEGPRQYVLIHQDGVEYLDRIPDGVWQKLTRKPDGSREGEAWVHLQVVPVELSSYASWRVEKVYGCSTEKARPKWFR